MKYGSINDIRAIEQECTLEQRNLPTTLYDMLCRTEAKCPDVHAVSFQIQSGRNDKAETLSWRQLHQQVTRAANLFSRLGIGENDVVALILPNSCHEARPAGLITDRISTTGTMTKIP